VRPPRKPQHAGGRVDPAASARRRQAGAPAEGLHNVVTYAPDLVCGGVPEGREGLHTLAAMGIKTVISVDGAVPDVATRRIARHALRAPADPLRHGITAERAKQTRASGQQLPGPVYLHCHHGKHRSAAALGSALVLAGKLTPEQAMDRMKVSGTAKEYTGLWAAVQNARPIDASELKADPKSFPSVSKVSGMVATMTEIDNVFDNVKVANKAEWTVPKDHPDLVPQKETKRLAALFAQIAKEPDCAKFGAEFAAKMERSVAASKALDEALLANDLTTAKAQYLLIEKGCKECHKAHRDN
jgi:cytochrome c556